jgi:hypothetical protein
MLSILAACLPHSPEYRYRISWPSPGRISALAAKVNGKYPGVEELNAVFCVHGWLQFALYRAMASYPFRPITSTTTTAEPKWGICLYGQLTVLLFTQVKLPWRNARLSHDGRAHDRILSFVPTDTQSNRFGFSGNGWQNCQTATHIGFTFCVRDGG